MNQNTTNQATAYQVSQQTANYVLCLQKCSELYSTILDALEEHYGRSSEGYGSEQLMEQDFCPTLDTLRDTLYKYIGQSIEQQQSILSNNNKTI